jgi:hypothetical protein
MKHMDCRLKYTGRTFYTTYTDKKKTMWVARVIQTYIKYRTRMWVYRPHNEGHEGGK